MTESPEMQKTPVSYSSEEAQRVRDMMSADEILECPRCGDMLKNTKTVRGPADRKRLIIVNCHDCNRVAFLPDEKSHDKGQS
jgi:RNase P subunit RPR2